MRALLPVIGEDQGLVLQALGGCPPGIDAAQAGAQAADRIDDLVARLGLKTKLRELGITAGELPDIAGQGLRDYMMINIPRPIEGAEIEELLRKAW
jgi:alcohol dehydrogenase class IV